jgi:hypothetical protein
MFNEVAQRLLGGISASTLLEQVGLTNAIPDVIQDLCGTTLIFRLKLNSRNLQECMENYKVSYTFEHNEELEMEHLNEIIEEVFSYAFHNFQMVYEIIPSMFFIGHTREPRNTRLRNRCHAEVG